MPRVFVVQDQKKKKNNTLVPKFNLTPAEKYGDLVYLLGPEVKPFKSQEVIAQLHTCLRDVKSTDYLLLTGNPILIAWSAAIASFYSGGQLNYLQWEGSMQKYVVVSGDVKMWPI